MALRAGAAPRFMAEIARRAVTGLSAHVGGSGVGHAAVTLARSAFMDAVFIPFGDSISRNEIESAMLKHIAAGGDVAAGDVGAGGVRGCS